MRINLFGRVVVIRKEYVVIGFIVLLMLFTLWGWYLRINRIEVFSAVEDPVPTKCYADNSIIGETDTNDSSYPEHKDKQTRFSEGAALDQSLAEALAEEEAKGVSEHDALININTCDVSMLTTLNGIGEVKANAIIAYRQQNGAFTSIEQITNVKGIGEATYEKIKDRITVEKESLEADKQKQSEE